MRVLPVILLGGAALAAGARTVGASDRVAAGTFRLDAGAGRYEVVAEQASAREILLALGRAAGVEVVCPPGWDALVTVQAREADLEGVIRAVAGNWVLLEEEGSDGQRRRRILVIPARDRVDMHAGQLYGEALDAFERPTRDEQRLMRLTLQRGWSEDGRALRRLFAVNAEALAAFEAALRAGAARFDWLDRERAQDDVHRGRELVDVYLVTRMAELASGDPDAYVRMAQVAKFTADVGRGGPLEARVAEDALRRQVLGVLDRCASGASTDAASLRSALRTLESHEPEAGGLAAAVEAAWPEGRIVHRTAQGEEEIRAGGLAAMPLRGFAPVFTAAMRSESETRGIDRSDLTTLRRVLEQRAQAARQENITRMRLAALAYGMERGAMPETVEDLVPGYLPAVPADPLTGEPFSGVTFAADARPVLPGHSIHAAGDAARPRGVGTPSQGLEEIPPAPDGVMPPMPHEHEEDGGTPDDEWDD